MRLSPILLFLTLVAFAHKQALAGQSELSAFPTAPLFTSVAGPVFPGPGGAVAVNASTMLAKDRAQYLTVANSVPLASGNFGVTTTYSAVGKSFAFSAGYVGTVGGTSPHGYIAGFAAGISKFSIGASVAKTPGSAAAPSADASLSLPVLDHMVMTTVFRDLAGSPQPTVGLGFRSAGFLLEFFVDMPPFNLSEQGNSAGSALTFRLGTWNFHGAGKQQTVTKQYSYTIGVGHWMSENIHLSVQYDDQQRVNAGLTLGL